MRLLKYVPPIVLPLISAIPWDGPALTTIVDAYALASGGWSPRPTLEPGSPFRNAELKERQLFSYATCGFISGSTNDPYTCFAQTASCVLDNVHSIFGCCGPLSGCQLPTSCVPHDQLATCDTSCAADPLIFKCDTLLPYCNQYVLSSGALLATAWYCSDTPYIFSMVLSATDGSQGTVSIQNFIESVPSPTTSTSSSASASSPPSSTVTITSGGSSGSSQSSTPNKTSSKSSTPVGAIVGGTIGGIALLAAIAFGIWFVLRTRKASNLSAGSQAAPPVVSSPDPGNTYNGQPVTQPEKEHYAPPPHSPQPPSIQSPPHQTIPEIYSPPHSPYHQYPGQPVQQPYMEYPPYAEVEGTEIMGPRAGPGHY